MSFRCIYVLMFLNVLFTHHVCAQYPYVQWSKFYGSSPNCTDEGYDIQFTSDGGYIIVGRAYSEPYNINQNSCIWLLKINSIGDTVWTKKYGGINTDVGRSVKQTDDDGYIIVGTDIRGDQQHYLWLLKTNQEGDTLWTKRYNGLRESSADGYDVCETKEGGYIIIGESYGKIWLLRTDSKGDTIWTKRFGGTNQNEGRSVQQTKDGGYILLGSTYNKKANGQNIFLLKTNAAGDSLWSKIYGAYEFAIGNCVMECKNDGFIITGWIDHYHEGYGFSHDIWLIKTDALGDTVWTRMYGHPNRSEEGLSVRETKDGSFIVTGHGGYESRLTWLSKTDSEGNFVWQRDEGSTIGSSIKETTDGGYIIVGPSVGADISIIKYTHEKVAPPSFNPSPDTYYSPQLIAINSELMNVDIRYTTDGSDPLESSSIYTDSILINAITTLKAKAYKQDWDASDVREGNYILKVADLYSTPRPGGYKKPINFSLHSTTEDVTIYYTLDETEPSESSILYSEPVEIFENTSIKAKGFKSDWESSNTLNVQYSIAVQEICINIDTDPIWYDKDYDGVESDTLSSIGSTISYGSIASHEWIFENQTISEEVDLIINLPTGTNKIILKLTSDRGIVEKDSIEVTVLVADLHTNGPIYSAVSQLNENLFFISSTDDKIYNFDSTGTIGWVILTGGAIQSTICASNENNIYVGSSDTRLYAFNYLGFPQWDKPMGGVIVSSPSVGPDSNIVVGITSGRLFSVSRSGTILWGLQTGGPITSSASIDQNGDIYFGSEDGKIYAVNSMGNLLWTFTTEDSISSSPAIGKDTSIVIGSGDGYLYKLGKDGELIWKFNTNGPIKSSPVIGIEGDIIIGSHSGYVFKINKYGEEDWRYDAGISVSGTAAIGRGGNIYIGLDNGKFLALSDDGNLLWFLSTKAAVVAPPLITQNNIILIGSTDKIVYILKDPNRVLKKETENIYFEWPTFKGNNRRTGFWGDIDQTHTGIKPESLLPDNYNLSQNYPNPFNTSTKISFGLPKSENVKLTVSNIYGQRIATLLNKHLTAGNYAIRFNGQNMPSGVYFYRIDAGNFIKVKKMIIIK